MKNSIHIVIDKLQNTWQQFRNFMVRHQPWSWVAAGAIVLLLSVGLVLANQAGSSTEVDRNQPITATAPETEVKTTAPSPLTGLEIPIPQSKLPIIGSMVSNSLEARPQTGLDAAGIVFEAVTEGGITRYYALYQDDSSQAIGPVRSLRTYYIDFSRAFDAFVAHVGGSPAALDRIQREFPERDLDQSALGTPTFERVSFRFAPHNVYTTVAKLQAAAERRDGDARPPSAPLTFEAQDKLEQPLATSIDVAFSSRSYNTSWEYDADQDQYLRHLAGVPHTDRDTKQQISVTNLVVLQSKYGSRRAGGTTYSTISTTGSGTAFIFTGGDVKKVNWSRPNLDSGYSFVTTDGTEVSLRPGSSWFAIQPNTKQVRYE